jgi:hypothetical protein
VAEEVLVNHQLQILNRILHTGDEVEVFVVEVEDVLKRIFEIDIEILGLELLRMVVVVAVVEEGLQDHDWMPL